MKRKPKTPIAEMLDQISPVEQAKTDAKMMIATRLSDVMQSKGITRLGLSKKMCITPYRVAKWLSGTHNFTVEELIDLQFALRYKLVEFP